MAGVINEYRQPSGMQIPVATDFRTSQTASSRYRTHKIIPEGALTSITKSVSSSQDVQFRFGAGYAFNLSSTRLRFQEQWAASGAAGTMRIIRALPPIRAVRLQTSAGVVLIDIQNLDYFMAAVYPLLTDVEDLPYMAQGYDIGNYMGPGMGSASVSQTEAGGPLFQVNRSLTKALVNVATKYGLTSTTDITKLRGEPIFLQNEGNIVRPIPEERTAVQYWVHGNQATYINYDLPLSKLLPHTVCAILQDLYFGTDLLLTISFAPTGDRAALVASRAAPVNDASSGYGPVGIYGDLGSQCISGYEVKWSDNTSPTASEFLAPGQPIKVDTTDTSAYAHAPFAVLSEGKEAKAAARITTETDTSTLGSIDLLLAVQDNLDLVNSVKQEIATKGLRIPAQAVFQTTEQFSTSTSSTTAYSRVVRMNIARGSAILRFYHGIFTSASTVASVASTNHGNVAMRSNYCNAPSYLQSVSAGTLSLNQFESQWGDGTVSSGGYRAWLNNVSMSDSSLTTAEVYFKQRRNLPWFAKSLCTNYQQWLTLGAIQVEDFTSGFDIRKTTPEGGLSLVNPIDIQIDMLVAKKPNLASGAYQFNSNFIAVMLKYLSISQAGVTFESV